jgi:hypothetical protein
LRVVWRERADGAVNLRWPLFFHAFGSFFGFGLAGLRLAASRRKTSASTVSRINCDIRRLPAIASMRAMMSGESRMMVLLTFSGGRPMRPVVPAFLDIGKSFIPSSPLKVAGQSPIFLDKGRPLLTWRVLKDILYGRKQRCRAAQTDRWIMGWFEWLLAELIYLVGIIALAVMVAAVLRVF